MWVNKTGEHRICVICKKVYVPTAFLQKTCSEECSAELNRRQTQKRKEEKANANLVYESPNMKAIREISKKGIHYGQIVAELDGHKV